MVEPVLVVSHKATGSDLSSLDLRRMVRQYYPRSYERLVTDYEFVVLKSTELRFFTSPQLAWLRKAVEEEGLGSIAEGFAMDDHYHTRWSGHTIWDVYPNDPVAVESMGEGYDFVKGTMDIVINKDPTLPPVLTSYQEHLYLHIWYHFTAYMAPREGSQVLAWVRSTVIPQYATTRPGTFPLLLGWRFGEGYTWSVGDQSQMGMWWSGRREGETYLGADAYFAMMMYSTGRGLPEDVLFVHRLKERFSEYSEKQWLIISMMEFVEKFGANTNPLMVKIIGMDNTWSEARRLYIAQDYEGSWSLFDQLLTKIDSFSEEAMALKGKTLFWVYVSEWCVVTAVSLLSGFTLWTLMVGRRLYRIVDQTRLRPPPGEVGTEPTVHRDDNRPWWREGELSRLFAVRMVGVLQYPRFAIGGGCSRE